MEKEVYSLLFFKVPSLEATQAANANSKWYRFERHSKTSCKLSDIEILFNVPIRI